MSLLVERDLSSRWLTTRERERATLSPFAPRRLPARRSSAQGQPSPPVRAPLGSSQVGCTRPALYVAGWFASHDGHSSSKFRLDDTGALSGGPQNHVPKYVPEWANLTPLSLSQPHGIWLY
jgi:hypothetical protein